MYNKEARNTMNKRDLQLKIKDRLDEEAWGSLKLQSANLERSGGFFELYEMLSAMKRHERHMERVIQRAIKETEEIIENKSSVIYLIS